MRVVLDTNVLVSGLLSPFQAPGEIVRMTSAGTLQVCYDARIISEYEKVLARPKFGFNVAAIEVLLEQIKVSGLQAAGQPLAKPLPDIHDEPFLQVAIAAKVDCLITGNMKHYPLTSRREMPVLSPKNFLDFYSSQCHGFQPWLGCSTCPWCHATGRWRRSEAQPSLDRRTGNG